MFNLKDTLSVSLILFSIIDILGSLPVIISLKKQGLNLHPLRITLAAGILMVVFLFLGDSILRLFGVDVQSFAIAGGIVIFLVGLEMVLGITLFREVDPGSSSAIVPVVFPLIAGAGTMTTLISLKSQYSNPNILVGIFVNILFVYLVLRASDWLEQRLGKAGANVLRKVFGIILLAISVKLIKTNLGV